jgi:hypothetical protein
MRTLPKLAASLWLLLSFPAFAILPESGWYWNPAQSGRGFNIEIQDNLLFVAAFGYDLQGQPTWWVAGGPMQSDRSFSARASRVSGGPCFGCAYTPPGVSDAGPLTIAFSDEGHATVTFLGESVGVRRQDFGNLTTNPDGLYGEWSTTEGEPVLPVYFGDRISLNAPFTSSNGTVYASGGRTGSMSTRVALGRFDPAAGQWLILVDSSTSYYSAYAFSMTALNRIEGQNWTYLKTSSVSGSGLYFLAHRTKSRARLNGFNAPGVAKDFSEAAESLAEAKDAARATHAKAKNGAALAGSSVALLREMQAELELSRAELGR